MTIFKVWSDSLLHKNGKGYVYLCDLCRAFYVRYHRPRATVEIAPRRKSCDWFICKAGSDLQLAAVCIIKVREERQLISEAKQARRAKQDARLARQKKVS